MSGLLNEEALAPKRPTRKRRRPKRTYVVVDQATEDTEAGRAAVETWLTEDKPR